MRILMVSPFYSEEGKSANTFVHARAKIYGKFGNQVKVFVPSGISYAYGFEGIDVYTGGSKRYKTVLEKFDPDIVAIHSPRYTMSKNPIRMLNVTRVPIIMWIHGTEALINALHSYFAPWKVKDKLRNIMGGALKITMLRFLIPKASAVIYASDWMRRVAERYLLIKHPCSFIVPNPVDTSLFSYTKRENETKSKGVSVRGLDWKYGMDVAIRAYSKFKTAHLTILGTGSLEAYMRSLASKCESNVSFMASHIDHNNMPEFYARFGYFVAPSRTEAQGLAMCEAMACGLPIIAASVGGIPEFVKDEINGLLVPPEDPYALRKAVSRLLTNTEAYNSFSGNGARFVKDNLSDREIYRKERELFRVCQERFNTRH